MRWCVLWSVLALASCVEPADLSWTVSIVDPIGCADVVVYQARIEQGGCGGDAVYDEMSFSGSSDRLSLPPALAPGRWGFRVRARDSSCAYVADRCVELDLPSSDAVVDISLSCARSGEVACVAAECESGLCPGDPVPAPRLRWPPSATATGTLHAPMRMAFRWSEVASATEYHLSLSGPCDGPAAGCEPSSDHMATTGLEMPLGSLGLARRPGGTRRAWRVRACRDEVCGPWSGQRIISIDRLDGDINDDGYADPIIGEPGEGDGRVTYLFGGPRLDPTLELIESPFGPSGALGAAIASADLDGDGSAEALVGAPGAATDDGAVLIARGTLGRPQVGRLAFTGGAPGERFGAEVAIIGDVDADGYLDYAVGAPGFGAGAGRVLLFLDRGARTQVLAPEGAATGAFGAALAGGDLDGDGFSDVVVGEPGRALGGVAGVGRVSVFRGGPDGASGSPTVFEPSAAQPQLAFGAALVVLDDLDGDSLADLVVGAPGWDPAALPDQRDGRVFLYRGDGAMRVLPPVEIATPSGPGARFGAALTGGDFDGDGNSDLAAGAPGASPGGVALLYLSDGSALPMSPDRTMSDAPAGAGAGAAVGAGDANGDGIDELLVGAPDEGAARVYLGARTGPVPLAATRVSSGTPGRFGAAVSLGR